MRPFNPTRWRALLLITALLSGHTPAAEQAASAEPTPPDQREVWVPIDRLKEVLEQHPNAVVLSREQYQTLLREAGEDPKELPVAPRRAVLMAATYEGRIVDKLLRISATLKVNVLSDEWSQIPLDFTSAAVGAVQVDGEAAFVPVPAAAAAQGKNKAAAATPSSLLLRGRGERTVKVDFTVRIGGESGVSRVRCMLPSAASSTVRIELPPGHRVESVQPVRVTDTPEATTVVLSPPPSNPVLELAWRNGGAGANALEPLVSANGAYTIDAEKLRVDYGFDVGTQLGSLKTAYDIVLPAQAKVLQVVGDDLEKWDVAQDRLHITLLPGERSTTRFWLTMELPSLAGEPTATVALPVPRIEGLGRMQGALSIVGDAGVVVKGVTTDTSLQPTEPAGTPAPYFVASYQFNAAPTAPGVAVERAKTRFSADLDTRVEFKPEAIFIERTVALHEERGELFQVFIQIPAGEEVLQVRNADDTEPDWQIADGKLRLRWSERSTLGAARSYKIQTRIEPEKWTQMGVDGLPFVLGDAKIEGAEKVTGYIALKADDAFRLEAAPSETLERRDGRTTPIPGDYAWFRRQDFTLNVKVAKRPGEVLAVLTGYALPLEGVLDLHAQIDYQFLHSGTRSVRIQVPEKLAQNFHFDGPQIAERNLNGDTWTIVFQKELTGSYALKVTAQVPVGTGVNGRSANGDDPAANAASETRFAVAVPTIVPLDTVRNSGVWAIEANTETEIAFEQKGMNELDSLLAPALAEYQPRHRVIGAFAWLGKDYTLALSGVRHAPASVLTSVVDLLELDTVVSTSGAERNQAIYRLRSAGAQYLDVQLPPKSRLLSLTVDDEVVKPVADQADRVRVQLAAKRRADQAVVISLIYETPKGEWGRTGAYAARAPKLAREIPVLRSSWRLYLPDGFEYTGLKSNLGTPEQEAERPLVLSPLSAYDAWRAQREQAILASSGISDPRAVEPAVREKTRRLDYERRGREEIENGGLAMVARDYEKAVGHFKTACDIVPNAPNTSVLYYSALERFTDASCKLAEQRIAEGRYADAERVLRVVLEDRYDPANKRAILILARLEQPDYYNKTISPQFRADVEQVKQWFIEAQGFYETGRYDLAKKRCEQILSVDKYNIAARRMEERIDRKVSEYGVSAYNETRANGIGQVDMAWQRPIRRFSLPGQGGGDSDLAMAIRQKLERIIIPKLELREATLREAIDFLKKQSVDLDIESPAGQKGVNIVLKLEESGNPTQAAAGQEPAPMAPNAPQALPNLADTRITVSLTNVPLIEALRYVTGLANLKFRIQPYAVSVVPLSEPTDILVTKEWKIPPDLIPQAAAAAGNPGIADRENAKNWLIANGVTFEGQSSAIFIQRSSRLIVRSTQEQLDLIDTILNAEMGTPPLDFAWRVGESTVDSQAARQMDRLRTKLERIIIPKLEFREATIREALDFLAKKARDLDTDSPEGDRGINIVLRLGDVGAALPEPAVQAPGVPGIPGLDPAPPAQPGAPVAPPAFADPADARITVSLSNIPLIEALRYVTGLANLKFKLEPYAISIMPMSEPTDVLLTKEWRVSHDRFSAMNLANLDRAKIKDWLISQGVAFNGMSSAIYVAPVGRQKMGLSSAAGVTTATLPAIGRLIVRNTQDQIDLIDTILTGGRLASSQAPAAGGFEPLGISGLLPMKLELPKFGRVIQLEGLTAAEHLEFRYDDWWGRARRLWLWFVGGGVLGLFLAGSRPWWRTCWVLLLLSLFPYCVTMTAMPVCNALLAGWLVAVVLQRLVVRLMLAPRRKEVEA